MKKKPPTPLPVDLAQPYVMGIADKLSDDPLLRQLLGPRFKVIVSIDQATKRVNYSFRATDDNDANDADAVFV